ncbi:MAG: LamG domain-containing protein [Clostridiales bacterium]|nr:LamG domain-containing protein [Clostridiales bacterium]
MSNYYLNFTGSESVTVPNNSYITIATNDFTISVWIYINSTQTHNVSYFISTIPGIMGYNGYCLKYQKDTNVLTFQIKYMSPAPTYEEILITPPLNKWFHYTISIEFGEVMKSYVNGKYNNNETDISTISGIINETNLYIGSNNAMSGITGKMDDIRFYKDALELSDITDIYNLGIGTKLTGSEEGLTWGSNCDTGEGTTLDNVITLPESQDGTLSTTAIWANGGVPLPEDSQEPIFEEDLNNFQDGNYNLNGNRIKASLQVGRNDGAITLNSNL